MYLHVIGDNEYASSFVDFVNRNYDSSDHEFLITKGVGKCVKEYTNCIRIQDDVIDRIEERIENSDKLIIHGLFSKRLYWWILKNRRYQSKIIVFIWGGELYNSRIIVQSSRWAVKARIWEIIKGFTFRRIRHFVFDMPGDYDKMVGWYKVKGDMLYAMYPQILNGNDLSLIREKKAGDHDETETTNVLVGNSSTETNNHIEVFDLISKFKDENIKIYVPLSYGNENYRNTVIEYGFRLFGDDFVPILEYMNPYEYAVFLSKMDVAIFNNTRQQAMANIALTAFFGSKLYIRDDTTMWDFYVKTEKCRFKRVRDINNYNWRDFISFCETDQIFNRNYFIKLWDEDYLKEMWDKVFDKHDN